MSLSREDSDLVSSRLELLTTAENDVVSNLFAALWVEAANAGLPTDKSDECAKLEAALVRYFIASRRVQEPSNERQLVALRQAQIDGKTIERKDWAGNGWCFAWAPLGGYTICGKASDYRIAP